MSEQISWAHFSKPELWMRVIHPLLGTLNDEERFNKLDAMQRNCASMLRLCVAANAHRLEHYV